MFSVSQSSSYTIVQNIKHKMSRYYGTYIQYLLFVNLHTALLACKMQIQIVSYVNVNVVVVIVDIDSTECAVVPGLYSLYSLYSVQWREWTVLSVETETRARQHRDL